ncbi:hypothetical protein [Jiella mangrovi]|uniref:DUF4148 domain-containing protein n=1 Tax=Jiella mangrovi TaxID=2821407 RepID=A0ABS4BM75_9HYPH|nr:hypothetical protein [Jiella mangrovi]MBP0617835.1 hypothetical protein [Jiella mangrovi]
MKTLTTLSAAILAAAIAVPTIASAAPLNVTGAPYNDNVDPQNLQAIQNQPTPDDPMIPGSSASTRLYNAQVRDVVSDTTAKTFKQAERQETPSRLIVPGSSADF